MSYICTNKTTKSTDNKKKDLINRIINEYRLKMNSFNPNGNSPNLFVKKLELRMKQYYGLYRSNKDNVK
mgnify:CR=1 FL=1